MRPALHDGRKTWSQSDLAAERETTSRRLRQTGARVFATAMDNAPAFLVIDEAASDAECVHVPLPLFFTPAQMQHAVAAAGVDALLVDPPLAALWPALRWAPVVVAGRSLRWARRDPKPVALPLDTAKITFTSGTTGAPKGVCLSAESHAAGGRRAWSQAMAPLDDRRHLCALPFAVLLENIAGLMAPLSRGATCMTLPLQELGLSGSSSFDAARFHAAVQRASAAQHHPAAADAAGLGRLPDADAASGPRIRSSWLR